MAQKNIEPKSEKIVIIENSVSFGEQMSEVLKKDGYKNIFLYNNGAEGLQGIYDVLPHLILLDIVLPDTDGYQILAKKQAEPLLAKIPLFLLSIAGQAINMRNIPEGSVAEVIISLHTKTDDILKKINKYFGYENLTSVLNSTQTNNGDAGGTKKKLLWVEDDKLIGTIMEKKLVSSGFDLVHVKNGEEALNSLQSRIPDLIVVDLLLPGMSGFDILEKIKEIETLKKVPRMVLSNLNKSSDIEKAKSLGANKFLVKASTSLDQIVVEVKELCK
jgi:CheY-like chemotaxis protein